MISEKYRKQRMLAGLIILAVVLLVSKFFGLPYMLGVFISLAVLTVYFMIMFIRSTDIMKNLEPKFENSVMYITLKKDDDVVHVYVPTIKLDKNNMPYKKQLDEGYKVISFDMLNFMYTVDESTDKRGSLEELNK